MPKNYFIEGIQGSGKSTLLRKMSKKYPDYKIFYEGDYCPVELAWCAYIDENQYNDILGKYNTISNEIKENTYYEQDKIILCYTKIITDIPRFHKDIEKYEIYNKRVSCDKFKNIVIERYRNWNENNMIFECVLFQNIIEELILFHMLTDEEIISFYKELYNEIKNKNIHLYYLKSKDIAKNIDIIRTERMDNQGNQVWFYVMSEYFNNSPYAIKNNLKGLDGMLKHFEHRQNLELQICNEIFKDCVTILNSKEI